jgi:tetratricopeptide (TPR) repeat protein
MWAGLTQLFYDREYPKDERQEMKKVFVGSRRNLSTVTAVFLICFLLTLPATGKTRDILADGEYIMGDGETMSVAEQRARKNAMQKAAEKAGAFVRSYSRARDFQLEADVIEVIANHAMKVTVLSKKREMVGDAVRFTVQIKAQFSEEGIEANLKKIRNESKVLDDYRTLKKEYGRQARELAQLKEKLVHPLSQQRKEILSEIAHNERQFRATNLLEEGLRRMTTLDFSGAADTLTKAIELNPGLSKAYAARAEARLFFGSYDELLKDANKAIALDGRNAGYFAVRAHIVAFSHCTDSNQSGCAGVIKDIRQAQTLAPKNPRYAILLGKFYTARKQFDLAAKEYDRAIQMGPSALLPVEAVNTYLARADFRVKSARGDYLGLALSDLDRAVAAITAPAYLTDEIKKFARLLTEPKSKQEGMTLFRNLFGFDFETLDENQKKAWQSRIRESINLTKNVVVVYWKRSQIRFEAGDARGAEQDRQAACGLNARDDNLKDTAGNILEMGYCTDEALFRPFASARAVKAYQYFKRGQRLAAKGKNTEAITMHSQAVKQDPTLAAAYLSRGWAYLCISQPDFEKALADYRTLIRLEPDNGRAFYERGIAYWMRAQDRNWRQKQTDAGPDLEAAIADYTKVLALPGDHWQDQALLQRGRAYETQKRYALAARDYDRLASQMYNFRHFLDKARVLKSAKKMSAAISALDQYLAAAQADLAQKGELGDSYLSEKIAETKKKKKEWAARIKGAK